MLSFAWFDWFVSLLFYLFWGGGDGTGRVLANLLLPFPPPPLSCSWRVTISSTVRLHSRHASFTSIFAGFVVRPRFVAPKNQTNKRPLRQAIPELDARVRNVKLLVEDLPWAHQPLLLAIVDLFSDIAAASQRLPLPPSTAWDSYHDETNANDSSKNSVGGAVGLSLPPGSSGITSAVLRDAAEGLAPAILRPRPTAGGEDGAGAAAEASSSSSFVSRRPEWEDELAATAVVELILTEQDRMLKGMRAEQRLRWGGDARRGKREGERGFCPTGAEWIP